MRDPDENWDFDTKRTTLSCNSVKHEANICHLLQIDVLTHLFHPFENRILCSHSASKVKKKNKSRFFTCEVLWNNMTPTAMVDDLL